MREQLWRSRSFGRFGDWIADRLAASRGEISGEGAAWDEGAGVETQQLRITWATLMAAMAGLALLHLWPTALKQDRLTASPVVAVATVLVAVVAAHVGWKAWVVWSATAVWAAQCLLSSPHTPNHYYLILWALVLFSLGALRGEGGLRDTKVGLAMLVAIVMFHSGLQKVWHGTYSHGEFAAVMMNIDPKFGSFLGAILPSGEAARILATGPPTIGAGPYEVRWLPATIAWAMTPWLEVVAGAGLAWRRSRYWAAVMTVVLIVLIQSVAREITFGFVVVALASSCISVRASRLALVICIGYFLAACFSSVVYPDWWRSWRLN